MQLHELALRMFQRDLLMPNDLASSVAIAAVAPEAREKGLCCIFQVSVGSLPCC